MKHALVSIILVCFFASVASGQIKHSRLNPGRTLSPAPGYIMINELTGGYGLGKQLVPCSTYFLGFTTIHGYQVNKSFLVAAGTGVYFYDGGTLLPVFLDFRYRVMVDHITPYVFGDGGFLIDFSAAKDTRLFLNPGVGVSYTLSRSMAVNVGVGLFSQFSGTCRDSFINFKGGLVYKF